MKLILLIPVLGLALLAGACRTLTPIDPNTMKPSDRCLPTPQQAAPTVHATK